MDIYSQFWNNGISKFCWSQFRAKKKNSNCHNFWGRVPTSVIFLLKYAWKFKVLDELSPTIEARWSIPFFNPFLLKSRFLSNIYGFSKKFFRSKWKVFHSKHDVSIRFEIHNCIQKLENLTKFNLLIIFKDQYIVNKPNQ